MIRVQLHLDPRQDQLLRALGRRRGLTRAELVREAIDLLLARSEPGDPLLGLIGSAGGSGRSDISERHDDILYVSDSTAGLRKRSNPKRR